MAVLHDLSDYTGTIGNLTAYKIRGSEKTYVRKKGGPSKKRIKEGKEFELTRLNNQEFGGRARASQYIMWAIGMHKPIADFNFAGPINSMLTHIQHLDPENGKGKRNIYLSRHPNLLQGFELNRLHSFSSFVRHPLHCTIDTSTLTGTIDIPELVRGINFIPQYEFPLFRFVAQLNLVPDVVWKDATKKYEHINNTFPQWKPASVQTEWYPAASGAHAMQLALKSETTTIPEPPFIAVLSISLQFGKPGAVGKVDVIKYVGGGQILAVEVCPPISNPPTP